MKTLFEVPTRADDMTQPGGIAIRFHNPTGEFIVHNFNTDRDTGTERHYFGGGYHGNNLPRALADFTDRVERAGRYDTGGSIDLEKLLG